MKKSIMARSLHKWLGLIIGLQMLIWLSTGLYMVIIDLDFIHGDPLVKNMQQPVAVPASAPMGIVALTSKYPDAVQIELKPVLGETYFVVTTPDNRYLIEPKTGSVVSPLTEETIKNIATFHFNGDAPILKTTLIGTNQPMDGLSRRLPLWRVDFDDRFSTSFYVDPNTGRLVTRRHQYWRIFDFMWMLHIMDYDERSDAHNLLLKTAEVTGVIFTITGLWLLLYSFSGRRNKKATGQ